MRAALSLAAWLGLAAVALAAPQGVTPAPDLSTMQSAITALQSQIPTPAATVPPAEIVGGSAGSAPTYRRGDAVQPRITRSSTVTLDASGTATFDWTAQGAIATPVQVVVTPVFSGSGIPKCWATAASGTSASIKCVVENSAAITLSIVTSGLTLNSAANGMTVGIVVLPKS